MAAGAGPAQRPRTVGRVRRAGGGRQRLGRERGGGDDRVRRGAVVVSAQLVPPRTSARTALDSQYVYKPRVHSTCMTNRNPIQLVVDLSDRSSRAF